MASAARCRARAAGRRRARARRHVDVGAGEVAAPERACSASSSTSDPRLVLTRIAPRRIAAICSAPMTQCSAAQCSVTMSEPAITSSWPRTSTPRSRAASSTGRESQVISRQPKGASSWDDAPTDAAESDDADGALAQQAAHEACPAPLAQLAVHARDVAQDAEHPATVSSATGSVTASGVLSTAMPRRSAASRSTLSRPMPTREITRRRGAASKIASVSGSVPAIVASQSESRVATHRR